MTFAAPSWFYFVRQFPRHTITMLFFLTLSGVMESLGAVSVLPLLGGLFGQSAASSSVLPRVHELFLMAGVTPSLGNILIIICAAMTAKGVLTFLAYQQVGYVEAEVTTRLRSELLDKLLRAKWSYFTSQPTGRLSFGLSMEATQAGIALRCFCQVLSQLIQALSYLVAGLFISWSIMLTGLALGGMFFALFRGLIRYVRKAGSRQAEALNAMSAFFTDALAGAKPLKVMAAEERFLDCIRAQAERFKIAARQQVKGTAMLITIQEPLLTVMLACGLYWSRQVLKMDEALLLTMAFFFHRLMSRLSATQQNYQQYASQEAMLLSLLAKIAEVGDQAQEANAGVHVTLRDCIAFDNVHFAYGENEVLRGLTLRVPFGAITALSGPSGSGKTTITDLVAGLARPAAGVVSVDGVPMQALDLKAWREQIGYVPQEVFLFNDTIRNNILIGREFSDKDIWRALELAGAKDFVAETSLGLDSMPGEQGRAISGGQRQRLMIARAVIANPRLLILDEATSGLDQETAEEILATVGKLKQGMAVLLVSHQECVRRTADSIYELGRPAPCPCEGAV